MLDDHAVAAWPHEGKLLSEVWLGVGRKRFSSRCAGGWPVWKRRCLGTSGVGLAKLGDGVGEIHPLRRKIAMSRTTSRYPTKNASRTGNCSHGQAEFACKPQTPHPKPLITSVGEISFTACLLA